MRQKKMRVHEAAEALNVSNSSIKRYIKEGRLGFDLTPSGQHVFTQEHLDSFLGKTTEPVKAFYARCSRGDKKNIESQLEKLATNYGKPSLTFTDRGSGLNENRPGLWRLMKAAKNKEYNTLCITAKDRLTRFGYRYLEYMLQESGVEILVLDDERDKPLQEELMQDFMSLLASFSGKFYKMWGVEQRKLLLRKAEEELDA